MVNPSESKDLTYGLNPVLCLYVSDGSGENNRIGLNPGPAKINPEGCFFRNLFFLDRSFFAFIKGICFMFIKI